jgi:hypothetical protein
MKATILLAILLLTGCSDAFRCVDGKLYQKLGVTDVWIEKQNVCKELK